MATRVLAKKKVVKAIKVIKVATKAKVYKLKMKKIPFAYFAPEAKEVFVAGSFNNWQEKQYLLRKDTKGYWKFPLELGEGRYEYRYIVDGSWANDQDQQECVPNSFGTWNSVIQVKP